MHSFLYSLKETKENIQVAISVHSTGNKKSNSCSGDQLECNKEEVRAFVEGSKIHSKETKLLALFKI